MYIINIILVIIIEQIKVISDILILISDNTFGNNIFLSCTLNPND